MDLEEIRTQAMNREIENQQKFGLLRSVQMAGEIAVLHAQMEDVIKKLSDLTGKQAG